MAFADPRRNIEELMIGEHMSVIDIGAGSGAYALAAAEIARDGKVYAADIQKDLLSKIKTESNKRRLGNIETMWVDLDEPRSTRLTDASVDRAIISNLLFQIENKETLIKETARIVRPKGRVMVIDWTDSFGGIGPTAKQVITAQAARALFERAGLKALKEFNAGDHHWGIIFERS